MKKAFWIIFITSSIPFTLFAQHRLDSLKKLLSTIPEQQRVEVYTQIAWEQRTDFPDSSIAYIQKAFDLIQQTEQTEYISNLYNFWGVAFWYKGNFAQALEKHKQALQHAQITEDTLQIAHAYHNIGKIHHVQTNYATAYTYFFQGLRLFEKIHDTTGMGYCYQSLSLSYQQQEKYTKAIEMAQKSLALRKITQNKRSISSALIELAHIYQKTGAYDSALLILHEAVTLTKGLGEKVRSGEISQELAETYYLKQNYLYALNHALQAHKMMQETANTPLGIRSSLLLGKIYYKTQSYKKSNRYLQFILGPKNKTGHLNIRTEALYYYALTQEKLGNLSKSIQAFKDYNAAKDSARNIEKTKAIGQLESKFDLIQKEQENNYLKEQEQHNKQIIAQQAQRNWALGSLVLLGTGLLVILIWKNRQTNLLYSLLKEQKEKTEQQYAEVKRSKEKLEELNKEKDGLMGIVAHDLKAPLNRIKGYVQIIKLTANLDEEQAEYLKGIEDASQSGRNLIRDLLDVSAYEQGDLTLHVEEIKLNELTEEIINSYSMEAQNKDLTIHKELPEVSIQSDYTLLSRIVENIFSNAIKFSPPHKNIYFKLWKGKKQVFISIRDEGPGFSEEDKQKMFKKFQQLSAQPTGGEQSTGLGLAIVKSLSKRLGGAVKLNSKLKEGAEFIIELPSSTS
ncbi:MAG: tetratricopeptide repeat-containing sensor histidine kinase [Flammeovirgaceae bacterium]